MKQEKIKCPECGHMIPLEEAISHDIDDRVNEEVDRKLKENEKKLVADTKKDIETSHNLELKDLKAQIDEKEGKLQESQKMELELRKQTRELQSKEKNLDLEIARKVDVERSDIQDKAKKEFEEDHRLKNAEKDKNLADMKKKIEELQRKAEQGSQKNQGEVLELELEAVLKAEFPLDDIEPVSSGVKGADILQIVKTPTGNTCGKILWEAKRTKNWSDGWLQKLKDDQREEKADLSVLVSEAMPDGVSNFKQISGIWVSDIPSALSLAGALRSQLLHVARVSAAQEGKNEKKDIMYKYLTGPEFRNRVEAIVESFVAMKSELDSEKRAMQKIWAKREKQIENVITHVGGMHGDMQGIVGASLPSIKKLELDSDLLEKKDKLKSN